MSDDTEENTKSNNFRPTDELSHLIL
jgi:hypothetical protein